jgi:aspartate 1-decarboxylase
MLIKLLKSKIHRAIVTDANLDYEGSIAIDSDLMKAANIQNYEKVHVLDITNGARLETYVIPDAPGSKSICINGAAAHLIKTGDRVIILSYCTLNKSESDKHKPKIIRLNNKNFISG